MLISGQVAREHYFYEGDAASLKDVAENLNDIQNLRFICSNEDSVDGRAVKREPRQA